MSLVDLGTFILYNVSMNKYREQLNVEVPKKNVHLLMELIERQEYINHLEGLLSFFINDEGKHNKKETVGTVQENH